MSFHLAQLTMPQWGALMGCLTEHGCEPGSAADCGSAIPEPDERNAA